MSDYIKELQVHLQESYNKAIELCDKAHAKQKDQSDKKARSMKLDIGDKVLVKNLTIEGKKKLKFILRRNKYSRPTDQSTHPRIHCKIRRRKRKNPSQKPPVSSKNTQETYPNTKKEEDTCSSRWKKQRQDSGDEDRGEET